MRWSVALVVGEVSGSAVRRMGGVSCRCCVELAADALLTLMSMT